MMQESSGLRNSKKEMIFEIQMMVKNAKLSTDSLRQFSSAINWMAPNWIQIAEVMPDWALKKDKKKNLSTEESSVAMFQTQPLSVSSTGIDGSCETLRDQALVDQILLFSSQKAMTEVAQEEGFGTTTLNVSDLDLISALLMQKDEEKKGNSAALYF